MSNTISIKALAACVAFGAYASLCGCSGNEGNDVAGGVSEETNTVAGILTDASGAPVSGAVMLARSTQIDTIEFTDTTSENGNFAFPITRHGTYGLSTVKDSFAYYDTFVYEGKPIEIKAKLQKASDISAIVKYSDESNATLEGTEVYIPGSNWIATTDSVGAFIFARLPQGEYAVLAKPRAQEYANAAYLLLSADSSYSVYGPYPVDFSFDTTSAEHADSIESKTLLLPLALDNGLRSWWSMDFTTVSDGDTITTDARNYTGSTRLYGNAELSDGIIGKSIHFADASSYGVIEDDHGVLDSLAEFTLEAFVKFNSIENGSYQKNIVGKLGFGTQNDRDVFSLALVDSACGASTPALALFIANGTGDTLSCENAAVSNAKIQAGQWIYIVATFKNGMLNIYQNASLAGTAKTTIQTLLPSEEPIFFGKENLDLSLDDIRLETKAISQADAFYRFYQKTGGDL